MGPELLLLSALLGAGGFALDKIFPGQTKPIGSPSDSVMLNQGNYDNWMKQLFGGGGFMEALRNMTGGGDPQAATNALMSMQPAFAKQAQGALSDVYSTGRAQAQAAGDDARRTAANSLANSGLLSSGAAIGAMTEATARPMMEMETSLAGQRANYLSGLQNLYGNMLGSGYGQANQMLGNLYGIGSQMNDPVWWNPQYQKGKNPSDYLNMGANMAGLFGTGSKPQQPVMNNYGPYGSGW